MALTKSEVLEAGLTFAFDRFEVSRANLEILDAQGQSVSTVSIASLAQAITEVPKLHGKQENGKNYIFKSAEEIQALLQREGYTNQSSTETAAFIINHPEAYREMPANYAEPFFIKEGKLFSEGKCDPKLSQNHFSIQLKNPSLQGKGSILVKLETFSQDPKAQSQESTLVELKEVEPGVFRSAPLVLVGKPVFDQTEVKRQKDNAPQDQTFLATLGGKLRISYPPNQPNLTLEAAIPVRKVLPVKLIVYKDEKGVPYFTPEEIQQQVASMQEIYAQAGIQVEIKGEIVEKELPEGVNLADGLSFDEGKILAKETANHFSPQDGVRILFVGDSFAKKGVGGTSIAVTTTKASPEMFNTVFIPRNAGPNVLAHEVMHCLLESAGKGDAKYREALGHTEQGVHHAAPHNLMSPKTGSHQDLYGAFHLTPKQIEAAVSDSPLLRNPVLPRFRQVEYRDGLNLVPQP